MLSVGYARVSREDQDLELQRIALKNVGCERIFEDKASGKNKDRPGLQETLSFLEEGDTLYVWKLDRLGRSVRDLIEISTDLRKRKINLHSITDKIDTSTHTGRFYFHIIAAFAEMERELIVERTTAGLLAARLEGRIGFRKTVMTKEKRAAAQLLLERGTRMYTIANALGVSISTLYRYFPKK